MSIDPARLEALNSGRSASRTLAEALAVDQPALLRTVVPDPTPELLAAAADAGRLGILRRMWAMGELLTRIDDTPLTRHPSDTVRGWVCFAIAHRHEDDPEAMLSQLQPFADDEHFAVREWAWMAARPSLVRDLDAGIALLVPWTAHASERIRRFASEALRPRGVWARHVEELKQEPHRGEPLLEPLRSDPSRYVQDSVANWINDAARTRPDWAVELCRRWQEESPTPATSRITKRALRSVQRPPEERKG
ncbi:DNA alkylation repair protein [Arachnia propionica]|uniref:DNA alkylation repair protein n=1 Tax=Arachnia propionica TaxID=1750 RepID=A0A3P1T6E9_9ACTN|nr:DNA alkylation repair protein [Arachnia propionica]RRD04416.1 DNA alkylation repair protein [Arachnia propionica]